jgi:hypothetical protein
MFEWVFSSYNQMCFHEDRSIKGYPQDDLDGKGLKVQVMGSAKGNQNGSQVNLECLHFPSPSLTCFLAIPPPRCPTAHSDLCS